MHTKIAQQVLLPVLQAVSRATGAKNLPVLANILLQTEQDKLIVSATNLEIGVIKSIPAEVIEPGEITVPARTFLDLVASLSSDIIELESSGEQLLLTAPNFSATLNGINSSEFPTIPLSSEQTVNIDAVILEESLPEITFAAAADEGRPVLTGILTQIKNNALEFVATDGFRLSHKTIKLKNNINSVFKSLIPRRTFEEVVKIISEEVKDKKDATVSLSMTENQNQMVFKIGNCLLSSRLIEGQFPSWERIVPNKFVGRAVVSRNDLLKAVKLASVLARNDANIVKLEVKKENITILSEAKQLGVQQAEVASYYEGEELTIAYNARFLIDVLSACKVDQMELHFSGNSSPTLLKPIGDEGLEYVIMPIRLS